MGCQILEGGGGGGGYVGPGAGAVAAAGAAWVSTQIGSIRDWLGGVLNSTRAGDLPATGQEPDSTRVKDDGNGNGQIRDYGPDGRAVKDFDFGHDHGAGDPHAHDWDWNKTPPRQPGRSLGPNE